MKTIEIPDESIDFLDIKSVSTSYAISSLGRAAYTLFITPEHEKLHQVVEEIGARFEPQPLQPEAEDIVESLRNHVLPKSEYVLPPKVNTKHLIYLGGVLIQFSDYVPKFHASMRIPYGRMEELHCAVAARAKEIGPLSYSDQLDTALDLTGGDVSKALWRLFITSRHYARWLDGKIVQDMPDLTREEKIGRMLEWRRSIAACKEHAEGLAQDPNGDTYYTWTHAFAKYMYSLAPEHDSRLSRAAVKVFHNGTSVMHKAVHTFNKQGVQSDHSVASNYGNVVGQVCVDHAKKRGAEVL